VLVDAFLLSPRGGSSLALRKFVSIPWGVSQGVRKRIDRTDYYIITYAEIIRTASPDPWLQAVIPGVYASGLREPVGLDATIHKNAEDLYNARQQAGVKNVVFRDARGLARDRVAVPGEPRHGFVLY